MNPIISLPSRKEKYEGKHTQKRQRSYQIDTSSIRCIGTRDVRDTQSILFQRTLHRLETNTKGPFSWILSINNYQLLRIEEFAAISVAHFPCSMQWDSGWILITLHWKMCLFARRIPFLPLTYLFGRMASDVIHAMFSCLLERAIKRWLIAGLWFISETLFLPKWPSRIHSCLCVPVSLVCASYRSLRRPVPVW